jgi:hypothetical protein
LLVVALFAPDRAAAQKPGVVSRESTATATVERVERSRRLVTFRTDAGVSHTVYAGPDIASFGDLQVGDTITASYRESTIVKVAPARPAAADAAGAAAPPPGVPGQPALQPLRAVVTIESVDPASTTVEYRTQDDVTEVRTLADKKLLEGLRAGQRVELTFTRERATSIERIAR